MGPRVEAGKNLIQNNQNVVVGSKFSNYMGEEVNLGWRFIKLLLGMGL